MINVMQPWVKPQLDGFSVAFVVPPRVVSYRLARITFNDKQEQKRPRFHASVCLTRYLNAALGSNNVCATVDAPGTASLERSERGQLPASTLCRAFCVKADAWPLLLSEGLTMWSSGRTPRSIQDEEDHG